MTIKLFPSQKTPLPGDAGRLPYATYAWLREAARRARYLYPGPLGVLLARELEAYADAGHQLAEDGLIGALAAEVLASAGSPDRFTAPRDSSGHGRRANARRSC